MAELSLDQIRAELRPNIRPNKEGERWAQKYTVQARVRAKKRHQDLSERCARLFLKHDTDKTGNLSRDQVTAMMKEVNNGTDPSPDEVEFIMRMARSPKPPLEALGIRQFEIAVEAWECYVKEFKPETSSTDEDSIRMAFEYYDTDKSGKLDFDQLKALMSALEGGRTKRAPRIVSDVDVEWLISKADIVGDGALDGKEFHLALCAWYQHLVRYDEEVIGVSGEEGGSCCTIS